MELDGLGAATGTEAGAEEKMKMKMGVPWK
jgi:hypothetical protein